MGPEVTQHTRMRAQVVLILLIWNSAVAPYIINTLTGTKGESTVAQFTGLSGPASLYSQLSTLVTIVASLLLVMRAIVRRQRWGLAALMLFSLPYLYLLVRSAYEGGIAPIPAVLIAAVYLALWSVGVSSSAFRTIGILTVVTALLSIATAVIFPRTGIFVSATGNTVGADKQIVDAGLLVGIFNNPNTLGQVLALGLPFVLLISHRWWARLGAITLVLSAMIWTASRTSIYAAVTVLVMALVLRLTSSARARSLVIGIVATTLISLTVLLPLATTSIDAFTYRGQIWLGSLRAVQQSRIFGLGPDWYWRVSQQSNDLVSLAFHGHNQFVSTFVSGGLLGILLAVMWIALLVRHAIMDSSSGWAPSALFVTSLLVLAVLETPVSPLDSGILLYAAVVPAALIWRGRINERSSHQMRRGRGVHSRSSSHESKV